MKQYDKRNIPLAKQHRKNMTPWERKLWYEWLRSYPVRFQRQKAIGNYIADFYCAKAGLVVELDGGGHYEPEQEIADRKRTEDLQQMGLQVFRICNLDIDRNFRGVCAKIDALVKESLPQSASLTAPSSEGAKKPVLISACLLGCRCRYDGASKTHPAALALAERYALIPVCPEQLGGLPTPRPPAERQGERVVTQAGADVTEQYRRGAEEAVRLARLFGCRAAVLKERSPSCGSGAVYDGTFTRTLTQGEGVAAQMLQAAGIRVLGESRVEELLDQ